MNECMETVGNMSKIDCHVLHIELVIAHIWYLSNRSCIMHNNTNKPKGMDMEIDMGPNGTYSK